MTLYIVMHPRVLCPHTQSLGPGRGTESAASASTSSVRAIHASSTPYAEKHEAGGCAGESRSIVLRAQGVEEPVHEGIGGQAFGLALEVEQHAVAQHGMGQRLHVLHGGV